MKCKEIIAAIEKQYGREYACSWDNVGLLVGSDDKDVKKIYIALDATDEIVDAAVKAKADMLLTHHPLIFKGMKSVTDKDFIGRRIIKLIQNDISYYAMHTNYDVRGMADLAAGMLKLKNCQPLELTVSEKEEAQGIGKVGQLSQSDEKMTIGQLSQLVKDLFGLDKVKVFGDLATTVETVAICPGSGRSEIGEALDKNADVLITGDIDHHTGIDSLAQGLAIIDAGHYGIEHIFIEDMYRYLTDEQMGVEIEKAPIVHPFIYV